MSTHLTLAPVDISIHPDSAGDLIIENNLSLGDIPANLGTWLRENARRDPGGYFLKQRDDDSNWVGLTHAETLARVNRISNGLVSLGLPSGHPVAILSENSINMALIQLAVMQVGLAAVPISLAYSLRSDSGLQFKHILDVTKASMLVMSDADWHMPKVSRWIKEIKGFKKEVHLFAFTHSDNHDHVRPFSDLFSTSGTLDADAEARFLSVTPATLAKIQFTSGSTNLPKGVMVTHGMMTTNQVAVHQMWPFLGAGETIVDWLPWNHTFGGNYVFNMMLMHGGTFYIDNGNPTPEAFPKTIQNIKEVSPTLYFGVPRSYNALYDQMKSDDALKQAFFKNLKFIFTAAAALDQTTFEGIKAMSREVRGEAVPFFSAWGATETAPDATLIYWNIDDSRVIGLPIPGVKVKLAADSSGKKELRVKGANVTSGYYKNPDATAVTFDDDGYYRSQDAGRFLDPDHPEQGLIFDGRTTEDFKLSSGTWVHNAALRNSINNIGQPYLLEVVIAAPSKAYLTAMVFPNMVAMRRKFADADRQHADDANFLNDNTVKAFFKGVFKQHNQANTGSSARIERFTLLADLPRIDKNETTDKGYINQIAVLTHRIETVAALYSKAPSEEVVLVDG